MTFFLPPSASGPGPEPDHPKLRQRPLSIEEHRSRWEVRAAQWRAHELAQAVFGRVGRSSVLGLRVGGGVRGLLHLEVPFADLDEHREREAIFLASAAEDPILSRVPLIYVVGPEPA